MARALIFVTVSEVLGQARWLWFSQGNLRPLGNLEHFDIASRGWLGSMRLLTVLPKNALAVTSCLVVVLSLAMGSFVQQAIKTTTCPRESKDFQASIPIAHHMRFPNGETGRYITNLGEATLPADVKGAMACGLVHPTRNNSAVSVFCPTGNCTFQAAGDNTTYSSIGICNTCIETTSFVTSVGPYNSFLKAPQDNTGINDTIFPNWTLPNGMWTCLGGELPLFSIGMEESLDWASSKFTTDFRELVEYSISNITILAFTQATCSDNSETRSCPHNVTSCPGCPPWDYVATSCALYPCLKNYHGSVREGILREKVISTLPAQFNWLEEVHNRRHRFADDAADVMDGGNLTALRDPCTIEGREYTAASNYSGMSWSGRRLVPINVAGINYTAPEECLYSLDRRYAIGMNKFLKRTLFQDPTVGGPECDSAWWLSPLFNPQQVTFETLSTAMDQFATIITNRFRSTGSSSGSRSQTKTAKIIVIETAVCMVFNWEWLLLPIALVVITVLLLGYMVSQSLRLRLQTVWKTSILPLLFYSIKGTEIPSDDEPRAITDLATMRKRAKHVQVRWQGGEDAGFVRAAERENAVVEDQAVELDSLLTSVDQASGHI